VKSSLVVGQITKKEANVMAEQEFEGIQRQLASLRRENRFLKIGLIFCLVLSALPYLTGFQPTVIRASKVVTERIEFIRAGKTVMSIVAHPEGKGLVIKDKNNLPAVLVGGSQYGGTMGVYDRSGEIVAEIYSQSEGGSLAARNNFGKPVAGMVVVSGCGAISLYDDKMHTLVSMDATPPYGRIEIKDLSGQTLWSAP
jgi:hypothetical protein